MKVSKKIVSRVSNPKCEELLKSHGLDDLLPKIYAAREVGCVEDVHYTLKNLLPFNQLNGITESAKIIVDSIEKDDSIVVVGDYDADGATSVAVSVSAFAMFGVKVNFIVPNRFKDGYGLTPDIINEAHEKYQAKLIISVDSGIRDLEGVDHANSLGMKVIITDHHIAGDVLPKAAAIVNPNMVENQDLAFKSMAGVGVAFYLMLGVRAELRKQDWFVMRDMQDPNMAELLDLVALGTIADVVKLDKNNRLMVFQGLLRIKRDKASAKRIEAEGKRGKYRILPEYANGDEEAYFTQSKAAPTDAEVLCKYPKLVDAESEQEVRDYLKEWSGAIELTTSEEVEEIDATNPDVSHLVSDMA